MCVALACIAGGCGGTQAPSAGIDPASEEAEIDPQVCVSDDDCVVGTPRDCCASFCATDRVAWSRRAWGAYQAECAEEECPATEEPACPPETPPAMAARCVRERCVLRGE